MQTMIEQIIELFKHRQYVPSLPINDRWVLIDSRDALRVGTQLCIAPLICTDMSAAQYSAISGELINISDRGLTIRRPDGGTSFVKASSLDMAFESSLHKIEKRSGSFYVASFVAMDA